MNCLLALTLAPSQLEASAPSPALIRAQGRDRARSVPTAAPGCVPGPESRSSSWGHGPLCTPEPFLPAHAPALSWSPPQLRCSLSAASNFPCCIFHKREAQKPRPPPWCVRQEADFRSGVGLLWDLGCPWWGKGGRDWPFLLPQLQAGEGGRLRGVLGTLPATSPGLSATPGPARSLT